MIAYMLTWTTYGTWLQGDERGWKKDGITRPPHEALERINSKKLKKVPVDLSREHQGIVRRAFENEAVRMNQQICAMAICSSHVHIILKKSDESVPDIVRHLKRASTHALWHHGIQGKVWTKGYDKRYCFTVGELRHRVEYVLNHEDMPPTMEELAPDLYGRVVE